MSIATEQMKISNKAVNGRVVDLGTLFGEGHDVTVSQQARTTASNETSGYFSGEIQGGASSRKNLYPDNNDPFISLSLDYKGVEAILSPKYS